MKTSTKIGAVLMACYLVAWLDRMAINMAMPFMAKDLAIGADKMGWILSAFFAGYALFQVPGGLLSDRIGPRAVMTFALAWWSLFTGLTGLATSFGVLVVVRFLFGVGEGLFPAAVWKVIGQFFTKRNRATANALVLSSVAIGPALTPLLLRHVLASWGWRVAFYVLGVLGVVALLLARRFVFDAPASHPRMSSEERAQLDVDADAKANERGSYGELLRSPVVWALFVTALAGNVTMYGWLNWLPTYLLKVKGLDLKAMALAASLPFAFGAAGCMLSGWVSDRFFRSRRKLLVLACQVLGGLALFGFTRVDDVVRFTVLQCAAAFLLFMSVGAVWAMPMVLLPTRLMGAGSGLINMGGQIGGFITNILIGYVITLRGGDYAAGFDVLFAGLAVSVIAVFVGVREHAPQRAKRGALAAAATALVAGVTFGSTGCLTSSLSAVTADAGAGEGGQVTMEGDDPSSNEQNKDAVTYRDDLAAHPGCTTAGLEARAAGCPARPVPATGEAYGGDQIAKIEGFRCAAKAYPTTKEDPKKPIVILVHGNSDSPSGWEKYPSDTGGPQLAERLVDAGFKVLALDLRFDKVDDPRANNDTENLAMNFDHGWAVPIAQNLFESVMKQYPDRPISIVGHSLGPTVIRDALRRLHRSKAKPFEHVKDLVFVAGAHHGVSSYRALCGKNPTMRGKVACELGDRTAFQPTDFLKPLNGPDGAFETPCVDGDVAFGQKGVCGGHNVRYTTLVMADHDDGKQEDEFVSEASSSLKGANNLTVPIGSVDATGYFCGQEAGKPTGLLKNHFGPARSEAALKIVVDTLSAP